MGIGSQIKITTYTYRIRTAYAITYGPIDEFIRFDYNSDYKTYYAARSGSVLNLNTSENVLSGQIWWGNASQGTSPNLSVMHEGMNYNNICYGDFHLDLGSSPAMPAVAFTVTRYYAPDLPKGYSWGSITGSSSGMNPAVMLYDLLTNQVYGYGLSADDIYIDSFVGASNQLANEDLTCSTVIDTAEVYAVVRAVLDWIDGELIYREDVGKIALRLRRKDYTLDQLVQVTASDIRAQTFDLQRPSWYATKNVVYVNFNDINRECDQNLVYAEDLANYNMTGNQRVQEFNFNIFTEGSMAQKVATRQLHRHSYPWAKVTFECFADKGDALKVFEPFWLQHDYYGVAAVFRITEKRRQGPNIWKIECVEECFCANSAFAAGVDEPYPIVPYVTPQSIDWDYRILNSYYRGYLVLGYSNDQTTDVILDSFVVESDVGLSTCDYACVGRLVNPVTSGHDATLYVQKDKHFQDDFSTVGYVLIDDEIMKIDSASETTDQVTYLSSNAHRALEETTQANHSVGAKVFALDCRAFVASNMIPGHTYTMSITAHYMYPILWFDSDDAVTYEIVWEPLTDMPKNPVIQSHSSDNYLQDITFTWKAQNRAAPIPTPCSGLTAYPQTDSVDQILGYKICQCHQGAGTTSLLTTYIDPGTTSYTSTRAERIAAGICTSFRFEVYSRGVKGFDSLPATIDIG
jgi:hypothetical protein